MGGLYGGDLAYLAAFLRAAQYFFIRAETACFCSALILRWPLLFLRGVAAAAPSVPPLRGLRPLLGEPLCKMAIASFRRSLSAINNSSTSVIAPNANIGFPAGATEN